MFSDDLTEIERDRRDRTTALELAIRTHPDTPSCVMDTAHEYYRYLRRGPERPVEDRHGFKKRVASLIFEGVPLSEEYTVTEIGDYAIDVVAGGPNSVVRARVTVE